MAAAELNRANSIESISFNFTRFLPNPQNLILQSDALVTLDGRLQLTKIEGGKPQGYSVGRVLYSAPVRIWDRNGNVASFVTSFSFIIYAPDDTRTADGLAFFLDAPDTQPKQNGGYLGIFNSTANDMSNKVVAVEFDTYSDNWDPPERHIGIDVNRIASTNTVPWDFVNGEVANVHITYKASTETLAASLSYPSRGITNKISTTVDLKNNLPEWVRVGISATSGLYDNVVETHDVLSWSFASTFGDGNDDDALERIQRLASYVPTANR